MRVARWACVNTPLPRTLSREAGTPPHLRDK